MMADSSKRIDKFTMISGLVLFLASWFYITDLHFMLLTAAQLILVPMTLHLVMEINKKQAFIIGAGQVSVFLLHVITIHTGQMFLSVIYLLFTLYVALCGLGRFFRRGFVNWAEISIDIGMMYLFMGGIWFFIHINGINTGFSPMLNWLTAIHFHYSAFLLPISIGFFGRIHKSALYNVIVPFILAAPMLVAIGITFWPILEFIAVIFYIFAIYSLIYLALKTKFSYFLQGLFIRLSFSALGITILFSLVYSVGRAYGKWYVTLDFMLLFHGLVNCIFFGLIGVLGWSLHLPQSKQAVWSFPVSRIRGKLTTDNSYKSGLVDDLSEFVEIKELPKTIVNFYEQTNKYRLFATTYWAAWFKPLLIIYKPVSIWLNQLNLPVSKKRVEMHGQILGVNPVLDGRKSPRAWVRDVNGSTVFTAIYSSHENNFTTYMNIALPLPFSIMIGILRLEMRNKSLVLSSRGDGDQGIYLATGKLLFKLPLSEDFLIEEKQAGELTAIHKMKLFGLPFLQINYHIVEKNIPKRKLPI
ncbi:YndJ family protein [Niallia taxi]|uniref:YndJ family protein n=1 Tax=Niallia taxi TaxID=2499688 RepID=UPI0015F75FEE|nr:YndJ family protein [Niallia taxi]MED4039624.1 YndJ family protein [Niallia taxi]